MICATYTLLLLFSIYVLCQLDVTLQRWYLLFVVSVFGLAAPSPLVTQTTRVMWLYSKITDFYTSPLSYFYSAASLSQQWFTDACEPCDEARILSDQDLLFVLTTGSRELSYSP